jgi:hypothetical protein
MAASALRHYPHDSDIHALRKACPEILGKCPDSSIGTKNTKKVRKLKEEGTLKMVWEDE